MKAFSIYGFENFENTAYPGYDTRPAMLFCGDDPAAKQAVAQLITDLGFEPLDVGGAGAGAASGTHDAAVGAHGACTRASARHRVVGPEAPEAAPLSRMIRAL